MSKDSYMVWCPACEKSFPCEVTRLPDRCDKCGHLLYNEGFDKIDEKEAYKEQGRFGPTKEF